MDGSQFELKSIMAGKAWRQGQEAAGHIKSTVGDRGGHRWPTFFLLLSVVDFSPQPGASHSWVFTSHLNLSSTALRYTKGVSIVIVNFIRASEIAPWVRALVIETTYSLSSVPRTHMVGRETDSSKLSFGSVWPHHGADLPSHHPTNTHNK